MKTITMIVRDGVLVPAKALPNDAIKSSVDVESMVMTVWQTGDALPVEPAAVVVVPDSVSPRQIRLALTQLGLRSTVENAIKAGSQDLKDWWEYSLDIERGNALINAMAQQLGIDSDSVDNLFKLAATL